MKKYVLFISGLLLMLACRPKQTEQSAEVIDSGVEVVELPKGFDAFYEKFHYDTTLQVEHIVFPLKNNTTNIEIGEYWTKDNWITHRMFDDYGGTFRRSFQPIGNMVIEKIMEANGMFYMERRFAQLSDKWNLIYYEVSVPTTD